MSRNTRAFLVLASLVAVAVAPLTGPASEPAPPVAKFAPNVVVDPSRLGGEPMMVTDSKGNIYISSIIGFTNHTSFLWKSEDGGESFDLLRVPLPGVQRPDFTLGGGDTALIVGPPAPGYKDDTLIFIDLEGLASFGTATTFDGGNTFVNDNVFASGDQPLGDRQWGGHWRDKDGVDHYYNFFNGLFSIDSGTNTASYAIIETTDYGKTWRDWKRNVTTTPGRSRPGPLFIDPANGDMMLTWTINSGSEGGAGFTLCTQQKVCTDTVIARMPEYDTNNTFVTGARDRAGNLYVAWSAIPRGTLSPATTPTRIYMATSTNKGKTWSKPMVVSGNLPAASMPSVVAGDPGRVSVVYYGTEKKGDPNFNAGPWYVYMSQSLNALSPRASFTRSQVSDHTNHINPICTAGLACTIDPQRRNDRNLIDFLYTAVGPKGETMVTWGDTAHQIGPTPPASASLTMFGKQVEGASLYEDVGTLSQPRKDVLPYSRRANRVSSYWASAVPDNWSADARVDTPFPLHGPGGPGQQNKSLDITSAWLERESDDMMKGTMMLRDVFSVQIPENYTNNFYMFWWWSNDRVHYAAAEVGPAEAGVSQTEDAISDCYAGEPSYSNPASARWALYTATAVPPPTITRIDCTLNLFTGRLEMHIPLSAVGAKPGDTLYSVTASSSGILQPNGAFNVLANLPDEADMVSPFTYKVGTIRNQTTKLLRPPPWRKRR